MKGGLLVAESPVEKRRKILIADDDRKTLSLLSEWLEREGSAPDPLAIPCTRN